jgi:hypothetical protein
MESGLRKDCVSVVFDVSASGTTVRDENETGVRPDGFSSAPDGDLRAAYVIVRVARPLCMRWSSDADVFIGPLRAETLLWTLREVVPSVEQMVVEQVPGHERCLDMSECSATHRVWHRLWQWCQVGSEDVDKPSFVVRNRFYGVWPYGVGHWFTGVCLALSPRAPEDRHGMGTMPAMDG